MSATYTLFAPDGGIPRDEQLICSFCGKSLDQTSKLFGSNFARDPRVYICAGCISACAELLKQG